MKKRKILVLIPMVGLFLSGCSFSEGFAKAKHWVADKIYHPAKDWIDEKTGKKEEKKDDEKPTPTPAPSGDVAVTGVTITPATLDLTTESADTTLTATVAPSNATNKSVTWSVDNEQVVTVSASGVVHVVGKGDAVVTATSVADATKKATCTVKVTEPGPGPGPTPTGGDGSETNPYSVLEALEAYKNLQDKEWSDSRVYIQGLVSEYNSTTNVYTLYGDETSSFVVYKPTSALAEGVVIPVVGDVAVFEGLVENYNGTLELTGNSKDTEESHKVYPTIQKIVSRGTSTISLDPETSEHATVTYEGSATNASQYSFTVAAASGYQVSKVTFGGETVEAVEGVYTVQILGNSAIKVETVEEGAVVPVTYKSVAFTPANTKGDTATSSYSGTAVFEVDDFELSCDKFNCNASFGQWNYIKCGHKNTEYDPTITTTSSVDAAIVQIDIKFGTVKEVSGMSAKIRVSTSSTFENATEYDFTPTSDTTVEVSLGSGVTNAYYQVFFHCPAAGNSIGNGYIRVDSVTYKVNP